jgi:hypothetical protein
MKRKQQMTPFILGSGLKSGMLYQIKELTKTFGGQIGTEFTEPFT